MSHKRSQVVRSSSTGEFRLLNQLKPVQKPVHRPAEKVAVSAPEQPRRSIFTIGSPVNDDGSENRVDQRYWVFLQNCSHCKKKLDEDKDVFMYGYLRAFCSLECREIQIDFDEKSRKPSSAATVAATKPKEEPPKRVFGSQVK